jgi:hypothetical protein
MYRIYQLLNESNAWSPESVEVTSEPVVLEEAVGVALRDVQGDCDAARTFDRFMVWLGANLRMPSASASVWEIEVPLLVMNTKSKEYEYKTRIYRVIAVG